MKSSQVSASMAVVFVLASLSTIEPDWINRSYRIIAFVCVILMIAAASSERRSQR